MKKYITTLLILSILSTSCNDETPTVDNQNNNENCGNEAGNNYTIPQVIENPKMVNSSANALLSDIGLSSGGRGIVIWSTDKELYANNVDIVSINSNTTPLWGQPVRVDAGIDAAVYSTAFSMESCGNAMLTWFQDGKSWYRNYSSKTGWANAREIDSSPSCISLSINHANTAFCTYYERIDGYYAVYSRKYNDETGWSLPERIDQLSELDAFNPSVKVDSDGNAIAVWQQVSLNYTDTYLATNKERQNNIWANRYISGVGWIGAVLIENLDKWRSISPELAMDGEGNAYVAWIYYDRPSFIADASTSVYFNKFSIIDGWGIERRLSSEQEKNTNNISVSVNKIGQGVVTWNSYHWQGLVVPAVKARQFDEFTLFTDSQNVSIGAEWISSTESASFFTGKTNPVTSINDKGLITTVWTSPNLDEQFFINTYTPGNGWSDAKLVQGVHDAFLPKIRTDAYGRSLVSWNQKLLNDSLPNVWVLIGP